MSIARFQLIVLLLLKSILPAQPCSWRQFEFYEYCIELNPASDFSNAQASCSKLAATLANVKTTAIQEFLVTTIGNLTEYPYSLYIGLTRTPGTNMFSWSDGSSVGSSQWKSDQPNNVAGVENCVIMGWPDNLDPKYEWRDRPCNETARYICQRNETTTVTEETSETYVAGETITASVAGETSCTANDQTGYIAVIVVLACLLLIAGGLATFFFFSYRRQVGKNEGNNSETDNHGPVGQQEHTSLPLPAVPIGFYEQPTKFELNYENSMGPKYETMKKNTVSDKNQHVDDLHSTNDNSEKIQENVKKIEYNDVTSEPEALYEDLKTDSVETRDSSEEKTYLPMMVHS